MTRLLALANLDGLMTAASPAQPTVDLAARTISGLVVPFGQVGETSQGRLQYGPGSLTWTDPKRVKLLVEHDQRHAIGYATELAERPAGDHGPAGVYGTFHVPPSAEGDAVLASAAAGVRDGLSVGVLLDDPTRTRLRRANGGAVAAAGQLREVSSVSVPAFDDSRVAAVASTTLVVSAWSDPSTGGNTVMPCASCGQNHAQGVACPTTISTASTPPEPTPTPPPSAPAPEPAVPPSAPAPAPEPTPAPTQAPLATAGAALVAVTSEPSVYTFDGRGPSLVRDSFNGGIGRDSEAADRLTRFNAQLADGNAASVMALAAVTTTADQDGDMRFGLAQPTYRPDLFRAAVDAGRPIISRIPTTPITSAAPFTLPVEGEFTGVDDHVEGTAHAPEGTLTGGDATVTPKAVSGAYRLARELIDASNPAIDRIAVRAMVRDYRRLTEAKAAAALESVGAATGGIDTLMKLRAELIDFMGDDDLMADFIVSGRTFFSTLTAEVDGDGRPMLASVAPANTNATIRAGWTGMNVDGVDLVKASAIAAGEAFIVEADAVLWAESQVQTFRFAEVEGPGIIKLALWAYCAAAIIDTAGVDRLQTAA